MNDTHHGYFDANATTPLEPEVRTVFVEALDRFWHNPSSLYREAATAKQSLELAREELADLLDAQPEEIVFTSGATEGNNAVFSWFGRAFPKKTAWISPMEHPSVREPARILGKEHWATLPSVDPLEWSFPNPPGLISMMAANNETGTLLPWQAAAEKSAVVGALFHCDAAQWLGKLPAAGLAIADLLTGSAHKFGGPKGVGFLRVGPRVGAFRAQLGGPQENRMRAGTENLPAILAMVAALRLREQALASHESNLANPAGREAFEAAVSSLVPGLEVVDAEKPRLWNTSLLVLPDFRNTQWLARLSDRGFCVSTGSACSSGQGASEILAARGIASERLGRVIRCSGTWHHRTADWLALADAMGSVWKDLQTKQETRSKASAMPLFTSKD